MIVWIPIAFQKISELFGSLSQQTQSTSENVKGLLESQGKPKFDALMQQISGMVSSTSENQILVSDFSEKLKQKLLQSASTSATSTP